MVEFYLDISEVVNLMIGLERNSILNPVMSELKRITDEANNAQILSEGSRSNKPYADLSDRTISERKRQGFGPKPILRRKQERLVAAISNGTPHLVNNDKELNLEYDKGPVWTHIHQSGTIDDGGTLPARLMVDPIQEDVDKIADVILNQMFKGL